MDSCKQLNCKEIGQRVKKRAKELGYTVGTLADEMEVEYATVSRIYRGESVRIEYIYELSDILGVSTDYLLKGKESAMTEVHNPDRENNMAFLSGLSDKELEQAVMFMKVSMGMCPQS